ncbi:hypothetical protein SK128_016841 [Halocaridina rubra]|uniref:Uncharacterized protein n=1 Tax=Halocaridina rubra TaxID=373956 RepID=A0AAN9AAG1_HALRR
MIALLLTLCLAFETSHGFAARKNAGISSNFPVFGYNLCSNIVHQPTREMCIGCFRDAEDNWMAASYCVNEWLPQRFASCAEFIHSNNGNGNGGNGNSGNGGNGNSGNGGNGNSGNGGNGNSGNGGNGNSGNGGNGNSGNGGNGNSGNAGNGNSGNGGNGNSGNGRNAEYGEKRNSGNGGKQQLISCLKKSLKTQHKEIKRAQTLYDKGGKYLKMVSDSNIIDNGGPAIFSCMAQELLWNAEELVQDLADDAGTCFRRFQMDPINERWHIHKGDLRRNLRRKMDEEKRKSVDESRAQISLEGNVRSSDRNIVYQYGLVGHDMPFHGVGPLAIDILKGDCVFNSMESYEDLDSLVAAILDSRLPVAAWIFQEILNEIASINLP